MRQPTCRLCGARVDVELQHADWHAQLEARLTLLEAHSENLIERTYALEGDWDAQYR